MRSYLFVISCVCSALGCAGESRQVVGPEAATRSSLSGADPARLSTAVEHLSIALVPRDHAHPENLNAAADYIHEEWSAAGLSPSSQTYEVSGTTYRNVIARLGPLTGPRVVVGAHYDAFGSLPGADDNASGTAALLELGRLLAQAELPFGVELVAYTLEEPPYFGSDDMGSAVHAQSVEPSDVLFMISLEMLGYYSSDAGSQSYPVPAMKWIYGDVGDFAAVTGRAVEKYYVDHVASAIGGAGELVTHALSVPAGVPPIGLSDHTNYWSRGMRALMITDTAFYRNTAYHTEGDTADRLNYEHMAVIVNGVRDALVTLTNEVPPA